jgi:hypothetical protein
VRAAFTEAWGNELARAKGEEAATTVIDLKSFYEYITLAEVTDGARQFGVPTQIILLTSHLYSGPRRIRVGEAHSRRVYPLRSILAGCTWATLFVRLIVIKPIETLLKLIHDDVRAWGSRVNLTM